MKDLFPQMLFEEILASRLCVFPSSEAEVSSKSLWSVYFGRNAGAFSWMKVQRRGATYAQNLALASYNSFWALQKLFVEFKLQGTSYVSKLFLRNEFIWDYLHKTDFRTTLFSWWGNIFRLRDRTFQNTIQEGIFKMCTKFQSFLSEEELTGLGYLSEVESFHLF